MNSALGSFLRPDGYVGPRGVRALAREGSIAAEAWRHAGLARGQRREQRALPYAGSHRRVATEPVLLIPGFMAGDWSLRAMARALRHHGLRTYHSDIAINAGCTRESGDRLERRLETIALRRQAKVTIVGHSLGGMLARGLAARRPDLVDGIVTMGSPVLAPAAIHQVLAWDAELLARLSRAGVRGLMGSDCLSGPCAQQSFEEMALPLAPSIGFTAIYSRRDGIVDWRSCLDPAATQIEVRTSHCGMAVDPVVIGHVVAALEDFRSARTLAAHDESEGSLHAVST